MSVYIDSELSQNEFIRTFNYNTDSDELIWHRDKRDRQIEVIQSSGWKLLVDGCYPEFLRDGEVWFIQAEKYHRLQKGEGDLILKIKEL